MAAVTYAVVFALAADADPEEVLWLLALVDDLDGVRGAVHVVSDLLGQARLLGVRLVAHPHVHDAALLRAVERYAQDVVELGVEHRRVGLDLDAARGDGAAVGAEVEELDRSTLTLLAHTLPLPCQHTHTHTPHRP